jgi:hypothetical protein
VDTGVTEFYNNDAAISAPKKGDDFYGQDAHCKANKPSYTDNKDGTITDNVTGLMWQKEMPSKMGFEDAFAYAKSSRLGGYDDWRMPTIKELYSLILFTGRFRPDSVKPFIDTRYFLQPLGQGAAGERIMDAQTWSATVYTGRTMTSCWRSMGSVIASWSVSVSHSWPVFASIATAFAEPYGLVPGSVIVLAGDAGPARAQ